MAITQEMPLVSVIMPAYNAARFIEEAIQSVQAQTITNWELLVIDDAATIYIVGQGISIIRDMIYRYFYAIGNTKIPAQNSILVSICNITVSLLLVKLVGFYGIIIGTVSASMISLVVIMIRFHKHIGFSGKLLRIIGHFLKNLAIMLITIMLVYVTKHWLPIENDLLRILVFGLETVIVYVGVQAIINKGALQALKKL